MYMLNAPNANVRLTELNKYDTECSLVVWMISLA